MGKIPLTGCFHVALSSKKSTHGIIRSHGEEKTCKIVESLLFRNNAQGNQGLRQQVLLSRSYGLSSRAIANAPRRGQRDYVLDVGMFQNRN